MAVAWPAHRWSSRLSANPFDDEIHVIVLEKQD
jgi:hypothetical protein